MSGHYIRIETDPQTGQSETDDWYATPCGDGCASLASTPGGPAISQARLVNGQWTLDSAIHTLNCPDGTVVPNAVSAHYTWDPNTLAGTVQLASNGSACGIQRGTNAPTTSKSGRHPELVALPTIGLAMVIVMTNQIR